MKMWDRENKMRDRENRKEIPGVGAKLYWRASYTIEAAIVVPLLLMVWCGILWLGYQLHDEVRKTAARQDELEIETMQKIWEMDITTRLMGE